MDMDHSPDGLWRILKARWPEKACPFCGEVNWIPVAVARLPVEADPDNGSNEVLVVGCRSCGFEWLHSVKMIESIWRKMR